MKCLLWFREKKNKEPKLYLKLNGKKGDMTVALVAILDALVPNAGVERV